MAVKGEICDGLEMKLA